VSELRITDLRKAFAATPVLEGIELTVPAGSLTAILGPSGSGKTTLLRVLAGLQRPDHGTIAIGARVVDGAGVHLPTERRRIGYVPQEGALFPHLTVQANVAFGLPRAQRRGGVRDLLQLVGLSELARRYPHQLSGGQQQRVALARALAVKPEIVLLDEPFASLDAHLRAAVRADVHSILREAHTTALLVTHDQDEALSMADQVAVLRDGRIAQCAAPHELYARPVDTQIARFIGEANLLDGVMEGAFVHTPLGRLPAAWHGGGAPPLTAAAVSVLIRPEQIDVLASDDARAREGQGEALLAGTIVRVSYHGHDMLLHVHTSDTDAERSVIVRTLGDTPLPPGTHVVLTVRGSVLVMPS
jgi:iron(III) transport system ATP-binding protein